MKFDNLLRYAVRILNAYKGEIPLTGWLKNFFRENPQMGSRDRKQVSEMVFCFFRLGHSMLNISSEERILAGLFLSNQKKEPLLEYLYPLWHDQIEKPIEDKCLILQEKYPEFNVEDIFPWKNLLSTRIDHRLFCLSFLEKPRLFIRLRPGHEISVRSKLEKNQIDFYDADPYHKLPFRTFSIQGGTKLEELITLNKEAVVQDLSSQHTALFLKTDHLKGFSVWDCCAGGGGKSILICDLYPDCKLTASDIRDSVLKNFSIRFHEAGLQVTSLFKADLTDLQDFPPAGFDFIIADLPCTGSGTWSRSPENLYYFKPETISYYRQRQQAILTNIIRKLNPGGIMVYITCSVFADENENVVSYIQTLQGIQFRQSEMINGYGNAADSMFVSRFVKE